MTSTPQRTLVLIAILAFSAVCSALISQYVFSMPPCAWCALQRLIYILIGIVCLISAWLGSVRHRLGALLTVILAACGVWTAYYQYTVASQLLSCSQTFADKLITGSRLDEVFPWVFGIYATCMDAAVKVLGIEYSVWSLALFVILALLGLRALFR
jgi:disulfide bond formation protein DsbB